MFFSMSLAGEPSNALPILAARSSSVFEFSMTFLHCGECDGRDALDRHLRDDDPRALLRTPRSARPIDPCATPESTLENGAPASGTHVEPASTTQRNR